MAVSTGALVGLVLLSLTLSSAVAIGLYAGGVGVLLAVWACQLVFALGWRRQLIPVITRSSLMAAGVAGVVAWWMFHAAHLAGRQTASQVVLGALVLGVVCAFVVQFARRAPRRATTVSLGAALAALLMCLLGTGWLMITTTSAAVDGQVRLCALVGVCAGLVVETMARWAIRRQRHHQHQQFLSQLEKQCQCQHGRWGQVPQRQRRVPPPVVAWSVALGAVLLGALGSYGFSREGRFGAVDGVLVSSLPVVVALLVGAGAALAGCAGARVASMVSFRNISAPRLSVSGPLLSVVGQLANPATRLAVGLSMAVLLAGPVVAAATAWLADQ